MNKSHRFIIWNIHGLNSKTLGNKLDDNEFLAEVKTHDIICLTETHENETSELNILGFQKVVSVKRQKVKNKSSGGIAVFIKQHLTKSIIAVDSNRDIAWVKIKKESFGLTNDVYLGTAYFSPERYENKKDKDYINELEEDVNRYKLKGDVLLAGDFNARTGNLQDTVNYSKYFDRTNDTTDCNTNSHFVPLRKSEDNVETCRGRDLIDFCISQDIYIVNGRKLGDTFGKSTCFQWNGTSVVDYLLAPKCTFDMINYLEIQPLKPSLSDHCSLTFSLKISNLSLEQDKTKLYSLPGKYKWDEEANTSFTKELEKSETLNDLHTISNNISQNSSKDDCISSVIQLSDVLMSISQNAGIKMKKRSNGTEKKHKRWFDKECNDKRAELCELGKLASRETKISKTRVDLNSKKKTFKKLVKKKKLIFKNDIISKMHDTNNDPKRFWQLLELLEKKTKTDIAPT